MSPNHTYDEAMAQIKRAINQWARARVLARDGRDTGAMTLLWDALPVLERELGPYHRDVAGALSDLAAIHQRRGEMAEAAVLLERVRAITHDLVLQPS